MSNFKKSIPLVLAHEGGFVNHPKDPGGATNFGITMATLRAWRGHPIAVQDVKDLKIDEAILIYKKNYWDPCRADDLPAGIDHVVFDAAVNSGVAQSSKWLQRTVGVTEDGIIGPRTLSAVRATDPATVIHMCLDYRLAAMKNMVNRQTKEKLWDTFGNGWQKRIDRVRKEALDMRRSLR